MILAPAPQEHALATATNRTRHQIATMVYNLLNKFIKKAIRILADQYNAHAKHPNNYKYD